MVAIIPVVALVISLGISWYGQIRLKEIVEKSTKEDQIKQTTLIETVSGLEIVKNVRAQSRMKTHWEQSVDKTVFYSEQGHHLSQNINTLTSFIGKFSKYYNSSCWCVYGNKR